MAVHIDIDAFRGALPADIAATADRLLRDGGVVDLESDGGGARAAVLDAGVTFQPWVGVIDRAFTGDCDCADPPPGEDFCAHAAAVALAAVGAGLKFSATAGAPEPPSPEPDRADYLRAARSLTPQQLTDLVVDQAARDPLFADALLAGAALAEPTGRAG